MKRLNFLLVLASILFSICAAPDLLAQKERLTTAKMKEILKSRVVKAENGDVYFDIKRAPAEVLKQGGDISETVIDWLAYYDPNYDFEKLNKMTVREAGKGGEKARSMGALLDAIVDFMATNNVKLRPVKVSPNNMRNRIENGQPYLLSIYYSDDLDTLKARSKKRETFKDMKEWSKVLREEKIKKFNKVRSAVYAQLTGFNKTTNEFRISLGSYDSFWITADELEKLAYRVLEPRL